MPAAAVIPGQSRNTREAGWSLGMSGRLKNLGRKGNRGSAGEDHTHPGDANSLCMQSQANRDKQPSGGAGPGRTLAFGQV